ncbi:restriction endonuclease subunit S [Methylohalobius crimeensis]|uniref:restriction endonuclease subunit S n=1 Tax=Methylohalobius crimeensis TaxID=244365 RepID=UPI0003B6BCED|nr:restriction endonuclease subunit S [Methylohalobius crimeensis]
MSEWEHGVLGDLVELKRGYDLPKKRRQSGPFPLVSSSGITDYHAEAMVKGPGVITGRYGTLGQVFFIQDDFWPLNTTLYVRDFKNNDPRFVSYFLRSMDFMAYSDKAAVPGLNRNHLHVASIYYPTSLEEQQKIAALLGALDDKIELNCQTNETLEAMARAIFKDWFVDFGPTRAKAEGREPYLATELWDLFPDALDDDDKPMGWEVRKLEDYLELAYGKSLPAKQRKLGSVAVYGSGGVAGTHDTPLVEGPVVIVGRKGTVGSLYWEDGPAFPIDTVFYVVPRVGSLLFSYHLLSVQPLKDMNTDAAVPGLNRGNAYRLEFPRPDEQLIQAFENLVAPLWKRRAANLKEVETLAQTRDLLLPKLMSGEIRLRDAEKAVEAVA